MVYASEIFRTPAAPYALIEARRSLKSLALAILVLLAALTILSFSDWRFAIVALMVVCVLLPMILLIAWLKLTATKEMQMHIRPQRWTRLSDNTLKVDFFPFSISDDAGLAPLASVVISKEDIERIESSGKYHTLFLDHALPGTYACFIIPSSIIQENPKLLLNL